MPVLSWCCTKSVTRGGVSGSSGDANDGGVRGDVNVGVGDDDPPDDDDDKFADFGDARDRGDGSDDRLDGSEGVGDVGVSPVSAVCECPLGHLGFDLLESLREGGGLLGSIAAGSRSDSLRLYLLVLPLSSLSMVE